MNAKRAYDALRYRGQLLLMRLSNSLRLPSSWFSGIRQRTFRRFYADNVWGSDESVSGPGSTLEATKNIRAAIPGIFAELKIRSILDAPCGDFHWFHHLLPDLDIDYLGADIVPELIARNTAAFGSNRVAFKVHDIVTEPLPRVDLWLCRDCLFHLPLCDVRQALANFVNSGVPSLLVTNHPQVAVNHEIIHGEFRPLNLQAAPFNLPEARWTVPEDDPKKLGQVLALWKAEDVAQYLRL
jgi:hypothetical protein